MLSAYFTAILNIKYATVVTATPAWGLLKRNNPQVPAYL